MKMCTKCKEDKDLSCFAARATSPDGLQVICKACQKLYREKNKNKQPTPPKDGILRCTACKQDKPVGSFNKSSSTKTGYFNWCKDCARENQTKRNEKYREKHGIREDAQRRRDRVSWFRELKANEPCADCGITYEPYCMDYDHLRDKVKSVSRMVLENTPKETILKEIEKCELVCLLCHNKRTYGRQTRRDESKYSETQEKNFEIIKRAKDVPCSKCGVRREQYNMQFDHLDPTVKYKDVCQLKNYKTETLIKEIEKCRVICAICHRRESLLGQRIGLYSEKRIKKSKRYIGETEQECRKCLETKPYSCFTKHAVTKNGYSSWCKDCFNKYRQIKRRTYLMK